MQCLRNHAQDFVDRNGIHFPAQQILQEVQKIENPTVQHIFLVSSTFSAVMQLFEVVIRFGCVDLAGINASKLLSTYVHVNM